MPAPAPPPDPSLVEAVRALSRAARLLERSAGELTLPQYRVLSAVDSGTRRASRLAERLTLGKPTVSASVDALCRRGLLARTAEHDGRATQLALTGAGAHTLARVEDAMVARLGDLVERSEDPGRLLEALMSLGAAIEELAEERAAAPHDDPVTTP